MNTKIKDSKDMLGRVVEFVEANPNVASAAVNVLVLAIQNSIEKIEEGGVSQFVGDGEFRSGSDQRAEIAEELKAVLTEIAATGRVLDRTILPGIAEQLRVPRSITYQNLLDAGGAFIATVTPVKAAFVAKEFPETFVDELSALVTKFQDATQLKFGGLNTKVLGTAALKAETRRGVQLVRELDALMVLKLRRTNRPLLESWRRASHIKKAPEVEEITTPSSPAAPGTIGFNA